MPCQTGLWFGLGLYGVLGAWQPGFGLLQWAKAANGLLLGFFSRLLR
jgi:hypothetical protein